MVKNRGKRRTAQYKAVLAGEQDKPDAKDKELDLLKERNKKLEDMIEELEQQLAGKELQNSEMEKTIEIYSTVPQHIVLAYWSLHLQKRVLNNQQL